MGAEEEGTATRRGDSEEGEGAPSRGQQLHVPCFRSSESLGSEDSHDWSQSIKRDVCFSDQIT